MPAQDFAQLARKFGGTPARASASGTSAKPDYATIAKQFGGALAAPGPVDLSQIRQRFGDLAAEVVGQPSALDRLETPRELMSAPPMPVPSEEGTAIRATTPVEGLMDALIGQVETAGQQPVVQAARGIGNVAVEAAKIPIRGAQQIGKGMVGAAKSRTSILGGYPGAPMVITDMPGAMNAASDIIEGTAGVASVALPAAAVRAPVTLGATLLLSAAAKEAAEKAASAAHFSPEATRLSGNVAAATVAGVGARTIVKSADAGAYRLGRAIGERIRGKMTVDPADPVQPAGALPGPGQPPDILVNPPTLPPGPGAPAPSFVTQPPPPPAAPSGGLAKTRPPTAVSPRSASTPPLVPTDAIIGRLAVLDTSTEAGYHEMRTALAELDRRGLTQQDVLEQVEQMQAAAVPETPAPTPAMSPASPAPPEAPIASGRSTGAAPPSIAAPTQQPAGVPVVDAAHSQARVRKLLGIIREELTRPPGKRRLDGPYDELRGRLTDLQRQGDLSDDLLQRVVASGVYDPEILAKDIPEMKARLDVARGQLFSEAAEAQPVPPTPPPANPTVTALQEAAAALTKAAQAMTGAQTPEDEPAPAAQPSGPAADVAMPPAKAVPTDALAGGTRVKLQQPGLNGPRNVVGTVTRTMPDGRVEVRLQQGGYAVEPAEALTPVPTTEPVSEPSVEARLEPGRVVQTNPESRYADDDAEPLVAGARDELLGRQVAINRLVDEQDALEQAGKVGTSRHKKLGEDLDALRTVQAGQLSELADAVGDARADQVEAELTALAVGAEPEEAQVVTPDTPQMANMGSEEAPAAPVEGWQRGPKGSFRINDRGNYELTFPQKPALQVISGLKQSGWRWAKGTRVWYHRPGPGVADTAYNVTGVARTAAERDLEPAAGTAEPAPQTAEQQGFTIGGFYNTKRTEASTPAPSKGARVQWRDAQGRTRTGVVASIDAKGWLNVSSRDGHGFLSEWQQPGQVTVVQEPQADERMAPPTSAAPSTPEGWTAAGTNARGEALYENAKGQRAYRDGNDGTLTTQKVRILPTGQVGGFVQDVRFERKDEGKPTPAAETPARTAESRGSYAPEVKVDGAWSRNALRFETEADAKAWGVSLLDRWSAAQDVRAMRTDDAPTHRLADGQAQAIATSPDPVKTPGTYEAHLAQIEKRGWDYTPDEQIKAKVVPAPGQGYPVERFTLEITQGNDREVWAEFAGTLEEAQQAGAAFLAGLRQAPSPAAELRAQIADTPKGQPRPFAAGDQVEVDADGRGPWRRGTVTSIEPDGKIIVRDDALKGMLSVIVPNEPDRIRPVPLTTEAEKPTLDTGADRESNTEAGSRRRDDGGQLPEREGRPAGRRGTAGESALGAVPAADVPAASGTEPRRPGNRRAEGLSPDRVPSDAGDGERSDAPPLAGGGPVPQRVDVAPTGVTRDPGQRPPDYHLTTARVTAIINRGPLARVRDNLEAIRLVKALAAEQRYATVEEQDALAKYVGWGDSALAKFLDDSPNWKWSTSERAAWDDLQASTTEAERKALIRSTPNAHFTFDLYRPIWDVLQAAGFTGGRILEPAGGTGHAFGFMPPDVRGQSTLNAVELEPLTAGILQALYPSARVQAIGYEQARLARSTQDLVISNVPFGDFGVRDTRFAQYPFVTDRIHNYFFAKALEHVRPGGLVVFVTSRYTMDSQSSQVRRYLMERAHFVGAVRLPNTSFSKAAKTEVVTDIIVLRRLQPGETASQADLFTEAPRVQGLSTGEKKVYRSSYYNEHPAQILGKETTHGSMYGGGEYTVEATQDDLIPQIREALARVLPAGSYLPATTAATDPQALPEVVEGAFKAGELRRGDDGRILRVTKDGELEDVTPTRKVKGQEDRVRDTKAVERIAGMIGIRDALRHVIATGMDRASSDRMVQVAQRALNTQYEAFVKAFGRLTSATNKRLFKDDPENTNLLELERTALAEQTVTDKKTGQRTVRIERTFVGKADVFTTRVVGAAPEPTNVETPMDALLASLGIKTRIDWPFMASLTGRAETDLQAALLADGQVYEQPDGTWAIAEEYLSGDVVTKLADAEAAAQEDAARFTRNVDALRAVQPTPKRAEEIGMVPGAHWIPSDVLRAFVAEELGARNPIRSLELRGASQFVNWNVQWARDAETIGAQHPLAVQFGERDAVGNLTRTVGTYGFTDLFNDALNLGTPRVTWTEREGHGKNATTVRYEDQLATLAARANLETLRRRFQAWVIANPEVETRLTTLFNERFTRTAERQFDGTFLRFPGLNLPAGFTIYPHQYRGIWRVLSTGNTLLAHEVGAGKTLEMIVAAMEMRRTGRARKPMITVPTHLLAQWRADIRRFYPAAKVAAFDEKDLDAENRQRAMAKIAFNDWDIVLVPQSSFSLLKVSDASVTAVLQGWADELADSEQQARIELGKDDPSTKQLERARRRIEDKMQKFRDRAEKSTDNALAWEQLGIDALFVDEAHNFKNLYFPTKMDNIRGLSRSESDRALFMFIKIQAINEASGYRNLVFATATPMMNSISEIFTMQRFLQPQTLRHHGVENFDNWYQLFARAVPTTEKKADGKSYHEVMRVREYQNLRLLSTLVRQVMDVVGWDDMPYLKLPKVRGGKVRVIEAPPHPRYAAVQDWLHRRLVTLEQDPPWYDHRERVYHAPARPHPLTGAPTSYDNVLNVMNDARMAAIDLRLVLGDAVPDYPTSRLNQAADFMANVYRREMGRKGTVLAFLDVGTPKAPGPLPFLGAAAIEDTTEGDALGVEDTFVDREEDETEVLSEETGEWNLYDALRDALVKRGVPAREIAYIHQARNAAERLTLFQAMNDGDVRILLASTEKGSTGMNIQTRLAAVLEIDPPRAMRPGDSRQRQGRAIRQGNLYALPEWGGEIDVVRFVTKGTTDEWIYGLLNDKHHAIEAFMAGTLDAVKEADLSNLAEAQAIATGDPRGKELIDLKQAQYRLQAQAVAAEQALVKAKRDIVRARSEQVQHTDTATQIDTWLRTHHRSLRGDAFTMEVGGTTYQKRQDANARLLAMLEPLARTKTPDAKRVGTLGGLPVFGAWSQYEGRVFVKIDATEAGVGVFGVTHIDQPGSDEVFGQDRNVVQSLVDRYEDMPGWLNAERRRAQEAADIVARAEKVIASPPTAIEDARRAQARIMELERTLTAESLAADAALKKPDAKADEPEPDATPETPTDEHASTHTTHDFGTITESNSGDLDVTFLKDAKPTADQIVRLKAAGFQRISSDVYRGTNTEVRRDVARRLLTRPPPVHPRVGPFQVEPNRDQSKGWTVTHVASDAAAGMASSQKLAMAMAKALLEVGGEAAWAFTTADGAKATMSKELRQAAAQIVRAPNVAAIRTIVAQALRAARQE